MFCSTLNTKGDSGVKRDTGPVFRKPRKRGLSPIDRTGCICPSANTLAERKKGQRSKWDCLNFIQLKTILERNWKLVEPKIASRKRFEKKHLMESLDRLNEIRNDLSHPEEGQTFEYVDELDGYLKDMAQFTKEVLGEKGERERETENA